MREKGSKLGEPCPKVRLSQDRLPKEPFAYFAQMSFAQMLLRADVTQPIISNKRLELGDSRFILTRNLQHK